MIIGRTHEISKLEKVYSSSEAEFVVIYGRRRVGKTYLIQEFFEKRECQFFKATGLQKGTFKKQLKHFAEGLSETFTHGVQIAPPNSWEDAFRSLTKFIETAGSKQKTVIFLDELPWMATRRSGLLESLDYYWNQYWSGNSKIILIVCGSSASWLIKNIIYNKGGLHNRCTCEIKLKPFNLSETKAYLISKGNKLNEIHILDLYMAVGGIPYYLKYVKPGLTAAENIQNIFFDSQSPLKDEFKKLFQSLFSESEAYIELIKLIAQKKDGVSRASLELNAKLSPGGGRLTERLNQLVQTNFIESFLPWDKERGEYYKVIDEFCLFYIYWLSAQTRKTAPQHWLMQTQKPNYHVWAGYAFEAICHKHIAQIIKGLHIKTAENISSWRLISRKEKEDCGAQIDLIIDRNDDAITLCEIKYTDKPFVIDKQYASILQNKINIFQKSTKTKKLIFFAMISANGIKETLYSSKMIDGVVLLEDLFRD